MAQAEPVRCPWLGQGEELGQEQECVLLLRSFLVGMAGLLEAWIEAAISTCSGLSPAAP